MCALLLKNGAKVDLLGPYGKTALHYACEYGRSDTVRVLLQHGARTDIKSKFLRTALVEAKECDIHKWKLCVEMILQHEYLLRVDRPLRTVCVTLFATHRETLSIFPLPEHIQAEIRSLSSGLRPR
eukprot:TRINITY_DN1840_c0_g1_i4.p1 TRINITY_DN1840_c0_g1~~TRINITY_DN1840_c0_g1_i4.p1  ORF type:complete len:126 (+),score=27.69 TRINITY_DN1840_c0_g1_i4:310-687(+)